MLNMHNSYLLISLGGERTTLGNGVAINETRSKRDVATGIVMSGEWLPIGTTVWFPFYAATPVTIDKAQCFFVKFDDILMSKEISQ